MGVRVPRDYPAGRTGSFALASLALSAVALVQPIQGHAATWTLQKEVSAGVEHTDNLDGVDAASARSSTLTEVTPMLTLQGAGKNADVFLRTGVDFASSTTADDGLVSPFFAGVVKSTLIDRILFLDGEVNAERVVVDANRISVNSLDIERTDSNIVDARLDPRIALELGEFATLDLAYGLSQFYSSSEALRDSTGNSLAVTLASQPLANGFTFGSTLAAQRITFDTGEPLRERSIEFRIKKLVGTSLQFHVSAGREWIDVPEQSVTGQITDNSISEQANVWDIGVSWQLKPRTSLIASYGKRSFGARPMLALTHQMRRSSIGVSWTRERRNGSASTISLSDVLPLNDFEEVAEPVLADLELSDSAGLPAQDTEITVDERISAEYLIEGRVSTVRLATSYIERDARFRSSRAISKRLSFSGVFERRLSKNLRGAVSFQRVSDTTENDAVENQLGISFTYSL